MPLPPILDNKHHDRPSAFEPSALIREARRQKGLGVAKVPSVCVLDPDGDVVRNLQKSGQASRVETWPCYHTELYSFALGGEIAGIVGCAVGAPFAVLVAEELFACGCDFLVSLTSAGQVAAAGRPPYFVVIDRAIRDEGTSYHYAAPSEFALADPRLVGIALRALQEANRAALVGASWTTDAPFRETESAIDAARRKGALTVEMEAAALYTFAKMRGANVLCLAHVTNTMGQTEGDFEKGEADGSADALDVLEKIVAAYRCATPG